MAWLTALLLEEDGQDLVEYGLLAAFISLAAIASMDAVSSALDTTYRSLATKVDSFNN
jgi:Flp pilus assembly pilin Flp